MNLFDLQAKITLDSKGYKNGIEEAKDGTNKFSAWTMAKGQLVADAVKSIGGAFINVGKQAIQSYADFEQNIGGVETLFKDASNEVISNASKAFQTAGLSANEYMETVTSFSASLLQSLGGDTKKSADYADQAIVDMSDNANKMGTSMESIQNAYQGFAKQNYTMLDNLKLGYGGTKEEMARLIKDASKLDKTVKDGDMSFGNITKAIHAVQNEMGITGTTSKEASETISGSISAMQSAWDNLLIGVTSDDQDFSALVSNFVDTVGTVAENLVPRIGIALTGASNLIAELVPVIIEQIPEIVNTMLPELLESGIWIIQSIAEGLLSYSEFFGDDITDIMNLLVDNIIKYLPNIVVAGVEIIGNLAMGLIQAIPELIKRVPEVVRALVHKLWESRGQFVDIGKNIVKGIWDGIKNMKEWFKGQINQFFTNIVNNVKEKLGIHSPSKVFAGIGEYMAEGVGVGWNHEFGGVKKGISGSLDFGTQSYNAPTANYGNSFSGTQSKVVVTIDDNANFMGLARALLPLLKVAEKEVMA